MHTSNWIIYGIFAAASAVLLTLWYVLGYSAVDSPFDLALSIGWWAVIAAGVVAISLVEAARRRRVRTCYVAPKRVYNPEQGTFTFETGVSSTAAVQAVLQTLKYGFAVEEPPSGSDTRFVYAVRTKRFKAAAGDGQGELVQLNRLHPERTVDANGATVACDVPIEVVTLGPVETWTGEVVVAARPDDEPIPFESRDELFAILEGELPVGGRRGSRVGQPAWAPAVATR